MSLFSGLKLNRQKSFNARQQNFTTMNDYIQPVATKPGAGVKVESAPGRAMISERFARPFNLRLRGK